MKNNVNNVTLAIVCAFMLVLVAGVVLLEYLGKNPDTLMYLAVAVAVPTVMGLATNKTAVQVKEEVAKVRKLVNGNTSRLLDQLEAAGVDVADQRAELAPLLGAEPDESGRHIAQG